jgi:hypothetical protein
MPKILPVIILMLITFNLHAQSWEVGGFAGGAGYMGDLNPTNPFKISGIAAGGFVKRNFNGYLSAKLGYTYGSISGADSTSSNAQTRARNLSFVTRLSEVSVVGEFNFMKYIPSVSENVYTPFFYVGISLTNYLPEAHYNGQTYDLRSLQTEGQAKPYSNTTISIPYGVGVKYNITGTWNLIADIGYRNTNTDYLDDVSGVYADKAKFTNPISLALSDRSGERTGNYIGAVGTQRGDLRPHDTYLFIGFSISYTFITQKCYY